MCGITGVFHLDGERVKVSVLAEMAKAISHRGPDDEGFYCDENIGLAHQRLSILDTSRKGAQPMVSKDQRWVVVFNGCIYNHKELREELKNMGHYFTSQSDTEVISEGLSAYGPEFFERFNGMFAIAAWDTQNRELYLSRDRFGVKPLYYYFNGKTLIFGSEIKAIIKHPSYDMDVDLGALNEYFTFQKYVYVPTLFKGL